MARASHWLGWRFCLTACVVGLGVALSASPQLAVADAPHDAHADAHAADAHAGDSHAAGAHAGGHADHDPHDLTHANASADLVNPAASPRTDMAIWSLVVFVLLLAVLRKFAWAPIMDALHKREHYVESQLEEARLSNEKSQRLLAEHQEKLAAAQEEIRQMMDSARRDADAHKQQVMAEAEQAAATQKGRAVQAIEAAKNSALAELAERSVNTAVGLAGQIVRRQLTRDDHADLVRDALDKFPGRN